MGLKQVDRLGLRSVVLTAAEDYPGTWLPWSIYALTSFHAVRQLHVTRAFQIRPSLLWYSDSLTHFYPKISSADSAHTTPTYINAQRTEKVLSRTSKPNSRWERFTEV